MQLFSMMTREEQKTSILGKSKEITYRNITMSFFRFDYELKRFRLQTRKRKVLRIKCETVSNGPLKSEIALEDDSKY